MSDELGTAVVDVVEPSQADISADVPNESTDAIDGKPKEPEQEKQDGRKQPDALKKHIADLRRQAESIVDPVEKKAALDRIKYLYDVSGKAKAYEEQFPTVREVREVKALLDTVGGRDGVIQMQSLLSEVEQIDQQLAAGDAKVIDRTVQARSLMSGSRRQKRSKDVVLPAKSGRTCIREVIGDEIQRLTSRHQRRARRIESAVHRGSQ